MEKGDGPPRGRAVDFGDRPRPARPPSTPRRPRDRSAAPTSRDDDDIQSLLASTLQRLVPETGATRAAAWWAAPGSAPRVVAAIGAEPPARAPSLAEYESLAALDAATDLRDTATSDPVHDAILRDGYTVAVPVAPASGATPAVLLLGGATNAFGRPRTLAALGAAARRLEAPLLGAVASTRLARLDADVRRLDRLAALGGLVAEIVHEVRNPLVSVKTFLQLLPERREDPEFLQSFLDVAGDELQRIERLLDLLLDHASPRMPAPGSGSGAAIATVVEAVERLVAHRGAAAGVRIESEVAAALPHCAIEPDALRQVLLNLVLNALDVTPAGGDVRVAARSIGRVVQIDVEDRGPGIPRALRRRVFEPFFSTKAERPGGLGLAISRRLVDQAAGTLAIADRPGGGTRFRMRLPTTPAPTA
jgi:signal transduction histidine kinase